MTSTATARGVVTVRVIGSLDAHTCPRFDRSLDEVLAIDPAGIVLDLSAIEFIDSHGLRSLVSARSRVGAREKLVLRRPPSSALRILELCGLLDEFTIEP